MVTKNYKVDKFTFTIKYKSSKSLKHFKDNKRYIQGVQKHSKDF